MRCGVAAQLLTGVAHIHARGYCNLDVSLENCLMDGQGERFCVCVGGVCMCLSV